MCRLNDDKYPLSTLSWHTVDILIITQLTSSSAVYSQLFFTDTPLSVDRYIWVSQHSANNQLTDDRVSIGCITWLLIEMSIERRLGSIKA